MNKILLFSLFFFSVTTFWDSTRSKNGCVYDENYDGEMSFNTVLPEAFFYRHDPNPPLMVGLGVSQDVGLHLEPEGVISSPFHPDLVN